MKKSCFAAAFMIAAISAAFCSGEAETGRGTAAEQVSEGQLLPVGAIDPGNYLSDFESDISNEGTSPLIVNAALMQDWVWERGARTALRIVLAANQESFFRPTPGLFVLFFQNPELLRNTSLMSNIAKLAADHRELDIRIFDSVNETLYPASTRVAKKYNGSSKHGPGRPGKRDRIADLAVRKANENPSFRIDTRRDGNNVGH